MEHHFSVELAKEYGILEAVLLNHFAFWIRYNEENQKNYYDGAYWTFNSKKAIQRLFPYVSEPTIRRAIKHLEDEGIIITGNFNKLQYDRTTWYTLTDKGREILREAKEYDTSSTCQNDHIDMIKMTNAYDQNDHIDMTKMTDAYDQNDGTIPVNNTDNNTVNNSNYITGVTAKRFTPPTVEEVEAYCKEKGYGVNAQRFVDFYESKGWMIGKNKMTKWKAAVATWEHKDREQGKVGINGIRLKPDTGEPDILDGIL